MKKLVILLAIAVMFCAPVMARADFVSGQWYEDGTSPFYAGGAAFNGILLVMDTAGATWGSPAGLVNLTPDWTAANFNGATETWATGSTRPGGGAQEYYNFNVTAPAGVTFDYYIYNTAVSLQPFTHQQVTLDANGGGNYAPYFALNGTEPAAPVPVPPSLLLLAPGLLGLVGMRKRFKK